MITRWLDAVRATDPLLLLLRASLLALLVNSNDDRVVLLSVAVVCVVALPRKGILLSPWFWAALFVLVGVRQLASWQRFDDHIIATTYWCGALALGLRAHAPGRTIAASARLLIAGIFTFATAWKLRSGEFIDGTFFRYSLLFDDRFETPARLIGGTSRTVLRTNLDALHALDAGGGVSDVTLQEGPRNLVLAQAFTYWGAVIESSITLAFLVPLRRRWGWVRHLVLGAFVVTTYAVVPVGGFGTLLLVLGAAQAASDRVRFAYYGGTVALLIWSGLWPQVFQ
jgi:hypothetical protein